MGLGAAVLPLFAQAQENCLKPHQLARMYSESFGDIAGFLRGEGWSNYDWGIGELECGGYAPTCCFNEPFLTQDVMFYAYAVGYDEYTSIEIHRIANKNNIVVYRTNDRCLSSLQEAFAKAEGQPKRVNRPGGESARVFENASSAKGRVTEFWPSTEEDYARIVMYHRGEAQALSNARKPIDAEYARLVERARQLSLDGNYGAALTAWEMAGQYGQQHCPYEYYPEEVQYAIDECHFGIENAQIQKGWDDLGAAQEAELVGDFTGATELYGQVLAFCRTMQGEVDSEVLQVLFTAADEALDGLEDRRALYEENEAYLKLIQQAQLLMDQGDALRSGGNLEGALAKYIESQQVAELSEIAEKIETCARLVCESLVKSAENNLGAGQLKETATALIAASECGEVNPGLAKRFSAAEAQFTNLFNAELERARKLIEDGIASCASGSFEQAKAQFAEAAVFATGWVEVLPVEEVVALEQEARAELNGVEAKRIAWEERIRLEALKEQVNSAISSGDQLFSLGEVELARKKFEEARELNPSAPVREKIAQCNRVLCERVVNRGDASGASGDWKEARNAYSEALVCAREFPDLLERIRRADNAAMQAQVAELVSAADAAFTRGAYAEAKSDYLAAIEKDATHAHAVARVKEINEIQTVLSERSTRTFDYSEVNSTEWSSFKAYALSGLNARIPQKKSGKFELRYSVAFDTTGRNLSKLELRTSIDRFDDYLSSFQNGRGLTAPARKGFYLAATDELVWEGRWETSEIEYAWRPGPLERPKGAEEEVHSIVTKYLASNHQEKYGSYAFRIREKSFNGASFRDIELVNYSVVGPSAAALSLVVPGWGTRVVSYGQRGKGKFWWFASFAGTAFLAETYSRALAEDASSTTGTTSSNYLKQSEAMHIAALCAAGVSGVIYLQDVIWVWTKGRQNLARSASIRNQLERGPVVLEHQPVVIR
jgi:tetratricopeptide (TPR) repeat protein